MAPVRRKAIAGLRSQDQRLGELISALKTNGLYASTNLVIVSDDGHTSVSGPLSLYPLRAITRCAGLRQALMSTVLPAAQTWLQSARYQTPGSPSRGMCVRQTCTSRGFKAYDGSGCTTSTLYGLQANGRPTVPVKIDSKVTLAARRVQSSKRSAQD
ncbi:Type I phosphodiesterase/nucleotide pyrophosphatase (fragment) (plasmid) [Cupriavidus taiwanensis]|uniref:Type I phosphodiesterase/nucleotide pyrophosphatase n=1 Tax=Cupriavidus taiwanensis TaxID=164546 RepID=A0A375HEQ3_9BURK